MKTVKLKQGIFCDLGKHMIPQGEQYDVTPSGLFTCPECKDKEPPDVAACGSWE